MHDAQVNGESTHLNPYEDDKAQIEANGNGVECAAPQLKVDTTDNVIGALAPTTASVNGTTASVNGLKTAATSAMTTVTPKTPLVLSGSDDPQALVISSLRTQISDLFSQVSQLNNKLVKSYDRVSDLEDDLHVTNASLRESSIKISQLELERAQHVAALNTGLLVEKEQVTAELTRLMERATDEAARRGQAESARADIEKDLDDLSANLFGQANNMVAEARFSKAMSERKVEGAEAALKIAEEAVSSMQTQMQLIRSEKEKSDTEVVRLREVMGKGKWVQRSQTGSSSMSGIASIRLLSTHTPYQEFLLFVAHLRSIRPSSISPPAMSTLLPLPFLARVLSEDSDPTIRLDFAPALNWLSRRSVLAAIYTGQLTIEPISSHTLLVESISYSSPIPGLQGQSANLNPSCALCGAPVLSITSNSSVPPPQHPSMIRGLSKEWSTALFKNSLSGSTNSANPSPPPTPPPRSPCSPNSNILMQSQQSQQQVYVFRFSQSSSTSGNTVSQTQYSGSRMTNYPLCQSGWCLSRLRTTCSLWSYIRTGVVEKVWEEEVPTVLIPPSNGNTTSKEGAYTQTQAQKDKPPPPPPRRARGIAGMSMGSIWERASGALGMERSPSKGNANPPSTATTPASPTPKSSTARTPSQLLPPPPTHPDLKQPPPQGPRRVPPPYVPTLDTTSATTQSQAPPPIPKRSVGRGGGISPAPGTAGDATNAVSAPADDSSKESTKAVDEEPEGPTVVVMTPSTTTSTAPTTTPGVDLPTPHPLGEDNTTDVPTPKPSADGETSSPERPKSPSPEPTTPTRSQTPTPLPTHAPIHKPLERALLSHARTHSRNASLTTAAAGIPLPDSRPGTPVSTSVDGKEKDKEGTTLSSPALSSPVAPPLPRRAAARRVVPPPPNGSTAPNAIAETASETAAPEPVPVNESAAVTPPEDKAESTQSHEPVAAHDQVAEKEESKDLQTSEKSQDPEIEEDTSAAETSIKAEKSEIVAEPEKLREAQAESVKKDSDAVDVPPPAYKGKDKPLPPADESGQDDAETKDEEPGAFVGETTWEERTWKEIVRLREEMFWARVGGLR